MHKYAYMAWDSIFSYFYDNWRKREFPTPFPLRAGRRNAYKEDARSSRDCEEETDGKISISYVICVGNLY